MAKSIDDQKKEAKLSGKLAAALVAKLDKTNSELKKATAEAGKTRKDLSSEADD